MMAWYNADLSSGGTEAEKIAFNNSVSGINANNVQGALDELRGTIGYTKKNLIPFPYYAKNDTRDGITSVINSDGSVSVTGEASETHYITLVSQYKPLKLKAGKYILSGCPEHGGAKEHTLMIGYVDESGNHTHNIAFDNGEGTTLTLKEDTNVCMFVAILKNRVVNNLTFYPMLRYASIEDSTYEPYVPSVNEYEHIAVAEGFNLYKFGKLVVINFNGYPCPYGTYVIPNGYKPQHIIRTMIRYDLFDNSTNKVVSYHDGLLTIRNDGYVTTSTLVNGVLTIHSDPNHVTKLFGTVVYFIE